MWLDKKKINSKKSISLLYIKKYKEIGETTHFTIATNHIIYLGVTLTKQVKDLNDKNSKSLKKEIEKDMRRWNDLSCSRIGRINIMKMPILVKAVYIFTIRIKISTQFS
jgi:ribosomal protein S13